MRLSDPIKRTRETSTMAGAKGKDGADGGAIPKKPKVTITDPEKEKEMDARAEVLMAAIYDGKPFDATEASKVQLFLSFNTKKKLTNFHEEYEAKIEDIENRLDDLERKNRELEMMMVQKDLIVRNIPIHNAVLENSKESNEQTIHQMTSFFNSINLILAPHEFPECYRTPEKPALEGRAKKVPIIILRFNSIECFLLPNSC